MIRRLYLGCPQWSDPAWPGRFLPDGTGGSGQPFLAAYSRLFNTAEGNTSFYAIPSADAVLRWRQQTAPGFRHSFKFHRSITHEGRLGDNIEAARTFIERFDVLEEMLGPFLIQLPPTFAPERMGELEAFITALPRHRRYALEVRHPRFYDRAQVEAALEALLVRHDLARSCFDARALFSSACDDVHTREARQRKPQLPVRTGVSGGQPYIRYVGSHVLADNEPWLRPWARVVSRWLADGMTPYFFLHMPDNAQAPALAAMFHALLKEQCSDIGDIDWPVPATGRQGSLF